jgi:hypothetical protein
MAGRSKCDFRDSSGIAPPRDSTGMRLEELWLIPEFIVLQDVAGALTLNACPGHKTLSSDQIFLGLF